MPNYELPQYQNPDILGAYLRGRAAPGALQLQQQQIQEGQQSIETQGIANQMAQTKMAALQAYFRSRGQGSPNTQTDATAGQGGPVQAGGQAPAAMWGPGQALGMNVPQSSMTPPDLEMLGVAFGENPLDAHLKAQQAQQAEVATAKELKAQQVLDPTNPGNPMPFLVQLTNMPSGNAQALKNNPQYLAQWEAQARHAGVKPEDLFSQDAGVADYAVKRVAYASALPTLQSVGKEGLIKAPEHFTGGLNAYGEPVQTSDVTGEAKAAPGYTAPGYTTKDVYDPATGRNKAVLIQTSGSRPAGGGGGTAAGGKGAGGPAAGGASAGGGVDLGMDKPTVDNQKAAKFALMFKTGTDTLGQMEKSGYDFGPKARGIILDAATNEGGLDKYIPGSAIFKQWMIKNGLSQKDQQYMAALMPALQAAGHSLGGARLTTSQIRSLYESILPVAGSSPEARAQVDTNRDKMFRGLVAESGSAAYLPEYKDTLGSYRSNLSAPKAAAQGAPKIGDVVKGYRYNGGPPHQQSSWEKQ